MTVHYDPLLTTTENNYIGTVLLLIYFYWDATVVLFCRVIQWPALMCSLCCIYRPRGLLKSWSGNDSGWSLMCQLATLILLSSVTRIEVWSCPGVWQCRFFLVWSFSELWRSTRNEAPQSLKVSRGLKLCWVLSLAKVDDLQVFEHLPHSYADEIRKRNQTRVRSQMMNGVLKVIPIQCHPVIHPTITDYQHLYQKSNLTTIPLQSFKSYTANL